MSDDLRTSATLLRRLRDPADRDAWAAFAENYGKRIYSWCLRWNLQEADAEDVTQGLLVQIPTKMRSFAYDPKVGSFRGWLKTVVRHALTDFVRALGRRGKTSYAALESVEAETDLMKELDERFEREVLEEAMARVELRVNKVTWDAFRLTAIEQISGKDAAAQLNIPVAHVYVYKQRVQDMLKEEIRKLEGE
ncbi:MAG: sigma-70 family RNA polymerase sigma factor [Planctomycetes bacterium]|nr:sigma-70 family RNA polymerase sigma factor [Planctomycetota bacterium]